MEEFSSISAKLSEAENSFLENCSITPHLQRLQSPTVMYFSSIIIPLLAASTQASVLNGECSNGGDGICLYTSTCTASGGSYVSNLCPDTPDDGEYTPSNHFLF
jgi:hypothetical protein